MLMSPHFWTPGGAGEQVTDERIARVERELGMRLPEVILAVLRIQNGGSPRNDAIFLEPAELTEEKRG